MKHLNWISTFIIVVSLIACGKNSPNKMGGHDSGEGSFSGGIGNGGGGGTSNPGGTIDGGGGNGIQGKAVERYKINVTTLPEFQLIKPILEKIDKVDPNVGAIIKFMVDKNWYLVPVSLNEIASAKTGLHFATDQIALQTDKEIWISSLVYNAKENSLEDKAALLLHEIVMGLKVLKFSSYYTQCMARTHGVGGDEEWAPEYCSSGSDKADFVNKKIDLTHNDYEEVRTLTAFLLDAKTTITKNSVLRKLADLNFSNERSDFESQIPSPDRKVKDIQKKLGAMKVLGEEFYANNKRKAGQPCKITLIQVQDGYQITVESAGVTYTDVLTDDKLLNRSYRLRTKEFGLVSGHGFNGIMHSMDLIGNKHQGVEAIFDSFDLVGFRAYEMLVTQKDEQSSSAQQKEDALICTTSKKLSKEDLLELE